MEIRLFRLGFFDFIDLMKLFNHGISLQINKIHRVILTLWALQLIVPREEGVRSKLDWVIRSKNQDIFF